MKKNIHTTGWLALTLAFLLTIFPAALCADSNGNAGDNPDKEKTEESAESAGDEVTAHPNRPSISDSPEVLPPGLLQVEYGFTHSWLGGDHRENELGNQFRFGAAKNLELRYGWDHFVREYDSVSSHRGVGDITLGAQYQFMHQSGASPDLAFGYAVKLPTASTSLGFSDKVDHAFVFLAGKHFGRTVFDVNTVYRLVGRDGAPGTDANGILIVTVARPIGHSPVTLIGEVLGESRLNSHHEAFATTLVAVSWKVAPRLVLDVGMEFGFTPHAPDKHLLVGFTYALGNFFSPERRGRGGHNAGH